MEVTTSKNGIFSDCDIWNYIKVHSILERTERSFHSVWTFHLNKNWNEFSVSRRQKRKWTGIICDCVLLLWIRARTRISSVTVVILTCSLINKIIINYIANIILSVLNRWLYFCAFRNRCHREACRCEWHLEQPWTSATLWRPFMISEQKLTHWL